MEAIILLQRKSTKAFFLRQWDANLPPVKSSSTCPHANCQRIKVAGFVVNLFHLAFVNYHKCHNHQKTTTDDLARATVWHFYLYTLCSVALSSLLCLSHIIPHLPHIIILPSHFFASSLIFLNADGTCKFEDFSYKAPHTHTAPAQGGIKSHYVVIKIAWIIGAPYLQCSLLNVFYKSFCSRRCTWFLHVVYLNDSSEMVNVFFKRMEKFCKFVP